MLVLMLAAGASSLYRASSAGPAPEPPPGPSLGYAPPLWTPRPELAEALPVPTTYGEGWRIVNQYSAHRVLIVEVQTDRIDQALSIAGEAIDGVKAAYSEVLVYFHRPQRKRVLASARVQWTPRHGYRLMNYEASEE